MSVADTTDSGGEAISLSCTDRPSTIPNGNEVSPAASDSRGTSYSMSTTSPTDRDDGSESSLEWHPEPRKAFTERKQGLTAFAKAHNLRLNINGPTDSDYDSDVSDGSFAGTPTGTPGRMERWKSFKLSSLFSRFQRQVTLPNRPRLPESPLGGRDCCRSSDDIMIGDSVTYMVPYDSANSVASPRKVISLRGLIKLCGRDTSGRQIVVIDTSYCPPAYMRFAALGHIREKMEPVVEGGEYNLVFVMSPNPSKRDTSKEVPAMWCLDVYRKLPYAYKKNVKRVVLIHPTFVVNLVLNILRPFMSGKAHEKIARVHHLADLDKVSDGEITLDKLYLASHVYLHDKSLTAIESSADSLASEFS